MIESGAGGGVTATELRQQLANVISILNWLGFGGNVVGASAGFGFWIALEKAVAKNILIATIAIVELDTPVETDLVGDAKGVACDGIKGGFGVIGAGWVNTIDSFVEASTGSSPLQCF